MPDTYHPSLEKENWREDEPTEEQPQEAAVEVETPEAEVQPIAEAQEQPASGELGAQETPPEDTTIKIDRTNLYQELRRLAEDPELGEVVKTFAGRTAKRQKTDVLEAQLKALQQENEALKFAHEMVKLKSEKGDEEIQRRLVEDPEFARKYHAKPEQVDIGQIEAASQVRERIDDAIDYAMSAGVPYQRIMQYRQAIDNGYFDYPRDAQGRPTSDQPLDASESLFRFNNAIRSEADFIKAQRTLNPPKLVQTNVAPSTPPAAAVEEKKPEANPALAMGGPDLSSGQGRSPGSMTMSEYTQLNPSERIERFPEGLEAAIASGKVARPR